MMIPESADASEEEQDPAQGEQCRRKRCAMGQTGQQQAHERDRRADELDSLAIGGRRFHLRRKRPQ